MSARPRARLPYLFLLRVPLLLALVLVLLPLLALTVLTNVLANLFVLGPGELFWVAFTSTLAAATVLAISRIVLLYGPARFGVADLHTPDALPLWQPVLALALAGWMIAFALWVSIAGSFDTAVVLVLAALAGVLAALVLVYACEALRFWWAEPVTEGTPPPPPVPDLVVPGRFMLGSLQRRSPPPRARGLSHALLTWLARLGGTAGYVNPDTGTLLSGHVAALVFAVALVVVYVIGFFVDAPHPERASKVPALVYLLVLLILPTWALAGATFLLDRYRVPVVIVPVLLLLVSMVFPTDHFFATRPQAAVPAGAPGAEPADLVRHLEGCRLTVVAASGGGIRAAGWTAQVLTSLHREVPEFTRSLRLISAVSGGSVATMYFVGAFTGPAGPPAPALDRIVQLSMRSSLNDVAWGFAYPDLWRTFSPLVLRTATDRAWALEQAWAREWPAREETVRHWRDLTAAGARPAMAFNATLVESGRRLAIGTFDTPPGAVMQTSTFEDVYEGQDITVVTAARLSATFTYVTPVARARNDALDKWHVADGGYQDNYGVATLVDWLAAALLNSSTAPADAAGPCGDRLRVAVVRIGAHEAPPTAGNRSWAFQIAAPVQVLLAIRTAGPKARNETELDLLAHAGLGPRLGIVCFPYEGRHSPLSWHLSEAQRRAIIEEWKEEKHRRQRQRLHDFLHGDGRSFVTCDD